MILLLDGFFSALLRPALSFDYWLFQKINQEWTNNFLDRLLPFIREQELWYPFYLFLLVFSLYNFGRKGCWWSLSLIMTIVMSDLLSSSLIKKTIFRLRPCQNPDLADQVRILVNYCPKNSSFTSSHACNHFAIAWFIFITLNQTGNWRWIVFAWAFIISYAQIYVGVHFPLDVLGGTIAGTGVGLLMSKFFNRQFGVLYLK
jgi:membrane-associated phospholipid phosphatase